MKVTYISISVSLSIKINFASNEQKGTLKPRIQRVLDNFYAERVQVFPEKKNNRCLIPIKIPKVGTGRNKPDKLCDKGKLLESCRLHISTKSKGGGITTVECG